MPINGIVSQWTLTDKRAQCPGHDALLLTGSVSASSGTYPVGIVMSRNPFTGILEELEDIAAELLATGDGTETNFTGALSGINAF